MGGLLGITSDLWTHYFLKWYDFLPHAEWAESFLLIRLTVIFFAYLLWWATKQIRMGIPQAT